MKHFSINKRFIQQLRSAALCLLIFTPLLSGLYTSNIAPAKVYAANNVVQACMRIGGLEGANSSAAVKTPIYKSCKAGYDAGYKEPNSNTTSRVCPTNDPRVGTCVAGFKQGQKDKKAEVPQSTQTIAQLAAARCKPYLTQANLSKDLRQQKYDACVEGYKNYKKGDDTTEACKNKSGPILAACLAGTDAAKNGKNVVPGAGGQGTVSATPAGTQTKESTDNNDLSCDVQFDNPLTWIICPVVKVLVEVIGALDRLINSQLFIDANSIFCTSGDVTDNCESFYNAWKGFRNIALGLMLIAVILVLIFQALGMEVLDAYTIRKVLPRLLIVAVAITLSWTLMNFAVNLSNDLGYSIGHLLRAPFDGLKDELDLSFSDGAVGNFFGGLGATGVAAVTGVALWIPLGGIGVLLSFAGTAALAVLVAVLTLILRQIFIVMMILIAPVAIVMFILPNTQRVYKMWWESFFKALLMFPMIVAFISTGKIFSAIALNTDNGGPINQVIGFVAYFAPYFMIPLTFRFAGSAMSTVGNAVNQQAQGGFNKLREARQGMRAARIKRVRNKGLYRNEFGTFTRPFARDSRGVRKKSSVGKMLNTLGNYTTDLDEQGPIWLGSTTLGGRKSKAGFPGFRRGAKRDITKIDKARRDQTAKAMQEIHPGYKAGRLMGGLFQGEEHDYLAGLSAADHREIVATYGEFDKAGQLVGFRAPQGLSEHEHVASIMARSSNMEAREAATHLIPAARQIEDFNNSHETNRVDSRLLGLMTAAKEGRLGLDDIAASHNELMAKGASAAEADEETTMLQELITPKRTSMAKGHGLGYNDDGTVFNVYKAGASKVAGESGPLSEKAQSSLMRMSTDDWRQIKSEDLEGAVADTFVAGASKFEAVMGPDGSVIVTDRPKTNPQEVERAEALRGRIKSMAQYNVGDSDVGVKIKDIWVRAGGDPAELEWGKATADHDPNSPAEQRPKPGPEDGS